jgi:hypothetical protein
VPPPSRVGPGLTEERVVVRSAGERVEPALDIVIAGIAAEELRRRGRSDSAEAFTTPAPARQGKRAAKALRESLKERALWHHPLVITGEAAGGGALPLPLPTPAQAPTLTSATEARMTSDIFFMLGDPGQVASACTIDGCVSATIARTTHPPVFRTRLIGRHPRLMGRWPCVTGWKPTATCARNEALLASAPPGNSYGSGALYGAVGAQEASKCSVHSSGWSSASSW